VQYLDDLSRQELIYEQFSTVQPDPLPPQAVLDPGGAITGLSSNTLVIGGKVGTVQAVELPQPLGTGSNPTFNNASFNSINTTDDATSRANLGLGNLATKNAAAASADTAPAQSGGYVQADVQAILNELRDLKTKLRAAGILTP
jgi:hypothetical protein